MTFETNDDLEIVQRSDGKWLVEDTAYRVTFGPYESRTKAKARREREVALRIDAIARERTA